MEEEGITNNLGVMEDSPAVISIGKETTHKEESFLEDEEVILPQSNSNKLARMYNMIKEKTASGQLFWIICNAILLALGTYGSYEAYVQWQLNPTLTTPLSMSFPLQSFPFPSVVLCTEGLAIPVYLAGFIKHLQDAMIKYAGRKFEETPIEVAKRIHSTGYVLPPSYFNETVNGTTILNFLYYQYINKQLLHKKNLDSGLLPKTIWLTIAQFLEDNSAVTNIINTAKLYSDMNQLNPQEATLKYYFDLQLQPGINMLLDPIRQYGPIFLDYSVEDFQGFKHMIFLNMMQMKLSCFDIKNLTAENDMDASFLKNCKWKGQTVSCASIFMAIPTDIGMCCAFNYPLVENMFVASSYSKAMQKMQKDQKSNAFGDSRVPVWFSRSKEPISRMGRNLGLQVTLDAHNDILRDFSIQKDFNSFTTLIHPRGDYTMSGIRRLQIRKGFNNLISMTGVIIGADDSIRSVSPESRNCFFPDEKKLKSFNTYSMMNCIFECYLSEVQDVVRHKFNVTCLPWYYPITDGIDMLCGPSETRIFKQNFMRNKDKGTCAHCLPECNTLLYNTKITYEPFRKCDDLNFGSSYFCKVQSIKVTKPSLLGNNFYRQVLKKRTSLPGGTLENIRQPFGYDALNNPNTFTGFDGTVFQNTKNMYNSFDQDIALLSIFFNSPTVWQFSVLPTSTTVIYFSNVSGLYGLCMGLCLMSLVEIVWFLYKSISMVLEVIIN